MDRNAGQMAAEETLWGTWKSTGGKEQVITISFASARQVDGGTTRQMNSILVINGESQL